MLKYRLSLYKQVGDNPSARHLVQEIEIEAADDEKAIAAASIAGIPKWDDSDHAILWTHDGRDVKHWTPN